jgi:hypothetical protein
MPTHKTVMVRSRDAGVFFGQLVSTDDSTVTLKNPRRVWYWKGAATLSELATKGPGSPKQCKFPAPTEGNHTVLGVCEIIPVTAEALAVLNAVPVWTEH